MTQRHQWAIFTPSIISASDNPSAHLYRALGEHLVNDGHVTTFYEQRANRWLRRLLKTDGAAAFNDFRDQFPLIEYRTYELRVGAELVEWLTRVLSTADIALVDRQAPEPILSWVGQLTRYHLQTFLIDARPEPSLASPLRVEINDYSAICVVEHGHSQTYGEAASSDRTIWLDAGDQSEAEKEPGALWQPLAEELARRIQETMLKERKRQGRA